MISRWRAGVPIVGIRRGGVPGRRRGPAVLHTDDAVILTAFAPMHVYRVGSMSVTLHVQLLEQCGNPTMWAADMPARAAERAVHVVEILSEGRPERPGNGRSHLRSEASHASTGEFADGIAARVLEFVRRVAARRSA